MKVGAWVGSWVALVATGIVKFILAFRGEYRPRRPLPRSSPGLESQRGALVKKIVQRPRTPEELWLVHAHGWSMPSGRTAAGLLIYTVWAILVKTWVRRLWALTWALAGLSVAMAGFSRIELGLHWTADV